MNSEKLHPLVIVNPNASRSTEALPNISKWVAAQANAKLLIARTPSDLEELLKEHGPAANRIAIGGGDGTISEALPQLLRLGKPVGVLPLGTANDFARTLELPSDPVQALQTAVSGRERKIDVGLVNGYPYVNVASVGAASGRVTVATRER